MGLEEICGSYRKELVEGRRQRWRSGWRGCKRRSAPSQLYILSCSTNALQIVQLWIMEMLTKFLSMKFKPCFEPTLSHQVAALSALREENEELREQNTSLSLVITKMAEKAGKTTRVWMFCLFNFEGYQRVFMLPKRWPRRVWIWEYLPTSLSYIDITTVTLTNPNLYMKVYCLIVIYIYFCFLWSVPSK